jgi:hypothetical protein
VVEQLLDVRAQFAAGTRDESSGFIRRLLRPLRVGGQRARVPGVNGRRRAAFRHAPQGQP